MTKRMTVRITIFRHPLTRIAITLALLGGLWAVIDTGHLGRLMEDIRWPWVLAGLGLVQCQIVASALRWQFTAACLGERFSRSHAVREYYLASLLNQILPGGVAGDIIRAGRGVAARGSTAWQTGVAAIVLERLAGQIMLFVIAFMGLSVSFLLGQPVVPAAWASWAAVALVFVAGFGLVAVLMRVPAGAARLHRAGQAMQKAWFTRRVAVVQLAYSGVIVAAYLAAFALASQAIGAPLSGLAIVTLIPITLLTMLLPVSIAGWGLREAAAAALWPLAGASAADGVAASLVYGLISLVGAAPGALVWWLRPRTPHGASRRA